MASKARKSWHYILTLLPVASKYAIFGGIGVALDIILYQVLISIGVFFVIANIVGYGSGTLASFMLNRKLNFRVHNKTMLRIVLFFSTAISGLFLSTFLLSLLIESFQVDPALAKLATLPPIFIWQFGINNFVTFKSRSRYNTNV